MGLSGATTPPSSRIGVMKVLFVGERASILLAPAQPKLISVPVPLSAVQNSDNGRSAPPSSCPNPEP